MQDDKPFGPFNKAATPEPAPKDNDHPAIADLVAGDLAAKGFPELIEDIMARKDMGIKKYGMPLKPFDGRDTLNDLYQEILDAIKYTRKAIYEYQIHNHKGIKEVDYKGTIERLQNYYDRLILTAEWIKDTIHEHQDTGNQGGSKTVSEG